MKCVQDKVKRLPREMVQWQTMGTIGFKLRIAVFEFLRLTKVGEVRNEATYMTIFYELFESV